jgi:adenylate kinase family enzyme
MRTCRIHITGASGSGTTTLGRALAQALGVPCHDTDDYLWRPSDPPYRDLRPIEDRLRLMAEMFRPLPGWVLSGSAHGWGDLDQDFDLVVFLSAPTQVRIARLRARESRRFGAEAVAPGGWRCAETEAFLDWAAHYDAGDREGRSLAKHEAWLETLRCPTLRLPGERPVAELVAAVVEAL